MRTKPWHVLLVGMAAIVVGRLTLGLRVVPYEPAIKAGFPDAKTLVGNGPIPILLMLGGVLVCMFAAGWMGRNWLEKKSPAEVPTRVAD